MIRITGINGTIADINDDYDKFRDKVKKVCVLIGEKGLEDSKKYAPFDTGILRDSASSSVTDKGKGQGFIINVKYDTPYALRMHEDHYKAKKPGTGRKYLERAMRENMPNFKEKLESLENK